ncbi:MAG: HD domain-containing protein [Erysipelotrichia bacterium]|nr:HD domain-containing protein [Erysipelotrichia bacterium]
MISKVKDIAEAVNKLGGNTYYIGGYVRDRLLNKQCVDIDIEVHGITEQQLLSLLSSLGTVQSYGKSYKIYHLDHCAIDISLSDHSLKEACHRRDLTINALAMDALTEQVFDFYNGINDLNNRILNYVDSETFEQDKLRVFRACRFSAVLDFQMSDKLRELCRKIDCREVAKERVFNELRISLLNSYKPSIFFENLRKCEQLSYWFKEVEDLIGVEQNPKYHREGDVYTHTLMVLDNAAKVKNICSNSLAFMLSALCHDFGKALTTEEIAGVIHSYGHEVKGILPTKKFLKRLSNDNDLRKYVLNMVRLHMLPNNLARSNSSAKATNKMFDQAIDKYGLILLADADNKGRVCEEGITDNVAYLLDRYALYQEYMQKDYVRAKDLQMLGIPAGKQYKELLEFAHKLRLAGVEKDKALKQVWKLYSNM